MGLAQAASSDFILDTSKKYRLITRSDFDGLACAVLLKHINVIDDIKLSLIHI